MNNRNCAGCIRLDQNKSQPPGNGYCAYVPNRVRKPEMGRCELYKPGKFEERMKVLHND